MRRQLMLIVFLLLGGGAQAFGWELPLNQWIESGNGFWSCTRKCYHLGEDLRADTDDMVYAIGEGTVVDVSRRTRFGTVILIEHETGDGHIVSLYGHLGRDDDSARIDDVFVAVGDTVNAGQEIGRIGDRDENGDWPPHLHFGINRGAYRGDGSLCYGWEYAGYTADAYAENDDCFCETLSEWLDPAEFLGRREPTMAIVSGNVTPATGSQNATPFRYALSATGGTRGAMQAEVIIRNPLASRDFPFTMDYLTTENGIHRYGFEKILRDTGTYGYHFRISTCAEMFEEGAVRDGPVVNMTCVPSSETCDGTDNDCDGQIDEGTARVCSSLCGPGMEECVNGAYTACTAPLPEVERCNRRDDDCDGDTDEEIAEPCQTACGQGVRTCQNGALQPCDAPLPRSEVCDGSADEDCDGQTDENCTCTNGTERRCNDNDVGECESGRERCVNGQWGSCTGSMVPRSESCNGLDDDCDGQTDEGVQSPCGGCGATPREVCNAVDDNCDGQTDETCECVERSQRECGTDVGTCAKGTQTCRNGLWQLCTGEVRPATRDRCNGEDNDCNGVADENCACIHGTIRSCGTDAGECTAGEQSCVFGTLTQCWGSVSGRATEICNGLDDTCDGETDETCECKPWETRACNTDVGECVAGTQGCQNGLWRGCSGTAVWPTMERCDRLDNDCDGATDEGLTNVCGGCGAPPAETCDTMDNDCDGQTDEGCQCLDGAERECGTTVGECRKGIEHCREGRWRDCEGGRQPNRSEVCDGLDDDCDGATDEGCICVQGEMRECGSDIGDCVKGIRTCRAGSWSGCEREIRPLPFEYCDERDNDCDGVTDEGGVCTPVTPPQPTPPPPPSCTPAPEICDGRDNDCDTRIDEELTLGCINECGNSGDQVCIAGIWQPCNATACPIITCQPEVEICDLRDNDCDGETDEGLYQNCSNTCGNTGVRYCRNGSWDECSAPNCTGSNPEPTPAPSPPPPSAEPSPGQSQTDLQVPTLISPVNNHIEEIPAGIGTSVRLVWTAVSEATEYEYEIRWTGGAVVRNSRTAGTSYRFGGESEYRAKQMSWHVRARGSDGRVSDWSTTRTFFFSDPLGTIFKCEEAACPVPGAYYQVSDDIEEGASPPRLTLHWVNYECLAGRAFDIARWAYIENYHRSAEYGGCPPP